MTPYALSALVAAAAFSTHVIAQTFPATPLASKHFPYPSGVPYQADTDDLIRGRQLGYNICNATTEGPTSLCQTSFVNSIDDFCLWAPSRPDSTIADTEGEEVAWCTKPGHGTRLIPQNTLKGVQYIRTPDYVQIVGFIDQSLINIRTGDYGGELDPHGADLRGNPLGGLMYSSAFGDGIQQVTEWTNFIGGEGFCIKVCDPAGPNAARYCEHVYDRIGCAYNAPNNAQTGVFETCQGDSMDFVGVYVDGGQTVTYTQPPESLGAITTMPYTASVPPSSLCTPLQSSQLYSGLPSAAVTSASSASTTASPTGRVTTAAGGSGTRGSAAPASTGSQNGASQLAVSGLAGIMGVVLAVAVFA